jgi:hypothetical protein
VTRYRHWRVAALAKFNSVAVSIQTAVGAVKMRADPGGVLSDLVFGLFQVEVGS